MILGTVYMKVCLNGRVIRVQSRKAYIISFIALDGLVPGGSTFDQSTPSAESSWFNPFVVCFSNCHVYLHHGTMNSFVNLLAVVGLGCKMPFLGPDANCKRHHGTPVAVLCCQFVSRALCP